MQVKNFSEKTGVSSDSIRYYTRIGLLKPERCIRNGYKMYNDSDLTRLLFIRRAKNLGFTLHEIGKILEHAVNGNAPCPMVKDILNRRIRENRKKLDDLEKLQARMEKAYEKWMGMPDKEPDGNSVCYLIESLGEL